VVFCSSSLLIRWHNRARCQAEIPLIAPSEIVEPLLYAHLWQQAFINGIGPRVAESGFGLIPGYAYSAPYEDVTLAGR